MAAHTIGNTADAEKGDERCRPSRSDTGESDKLMSELIGTMAEIDNSGKEITSR